jgi:60 kDa SS-A/Ro ribonucleoprotein
MTPNSAGGYTFKITSIERLRRFLILGSEGGTYYASERKLTEENARAVRAALDEHGVEAVREIVDVSVDGRAAKQDPAIFALAMAASHKDVEVRRLALRALPAVCRTGTALFHFQDFVESFRGRGRALNNATARWYTDQPVEKVAYQAVKYRQRDGWSHRDLMRLVRFRGDDLSPEQHALVRWIAGRPMNYRGIDLTDRAAGAPV